MRTLSRLKKICGFLEHLCFSNYVPGSLNISTKYTLIFSLCLELLYLKLLSVSDKDFGPVATVLSFCISRQLWSCYKNIIDSQQFKHLWDLKCEFQYVKQLRDLELYLRIRISRQSDFRAHGLNETSDFFSRIDGIQRTLF